MEEPESFIIQNVTMNYQYISDIRLQLDPLQVEDLTWWDAKDDSHRETPDWVTPEMMSAVRSFNPSHTKKKLETKNFDKLWPLRLTLKNMSLFLKTIAPK